MSKKYWNENDQKKSKNGLIISNFCETYFQCKEDTRLHKEEMKNIDWKHWEHLFFYSWNSGKNMKNTIFFIIWKPDFRKHGEHLENKKRSLPHNFCSQKQKIDFENTNQTCSNFSSSTWLITTYGWGIGLQTWKATRTFNMEKLDQVSIKILVIMDISVLRF